MTFPLFPAGEAAVLAVEKAAFGVTGERVALHAAGRTDAGVHALAMEAHADIAKPLTEHRLREGLNALVRPNPVSVLDVAQDMMNGKDTTTGHWEMMGIVLDRPFPVFPNGFSKDVIDAFEQRIGRGTLQASGVGDLERLVKLDLLLLGEPDQVTQRTGGRPLARAHRGRNR